MKKPATQEHFQELMNVETDVLAMVVKAHHSIDSLLDETLLLRMPNAEALELRRVSFLLKVDFLIGLGVMHQRLRPLFDKVNSVRNRFAHNPYAHIEQGDLGKLKQLLLAQKPTVVTPDFSKTGATLDILQMLFAVCFVNLLVAYENLARQEVASIVSNQLMRETIAGDVHREIPGLSVHDEFNKRCEAIMKSRYPDIKFVGQINDEGLKWDVFRLA